MKITIKHGSSAFTLCGLIVGIMLIVVGVIMVELLVRACKIPPRQLPKEVEEQYPDYQTNSANNPPWPDQYNPITRYFTPPPENNGIYEKVTIASAFYVDMSFDTINWEPVLLWEDDPEVGAVSDWWGVPELIGFQVMELDGVTYQMKLDFSGIDINPSPSFKTNHPCAFWRVRAYD